MCVFVPCRLQFCVCRTPTTRKPNKNANGCAPQKCLRKYSILGMNLFGCKFCDKDGDETDCDRKNFDSLLWALVTVFQVDATFIFIPIPSILCHDKITPVCVQLSLTRNSIMVFCSVFFGLVFFYLLPPSCPTNITNTYTHP